MAYEFRLPDLGEGIAEGELVKWLVREGDLVGEHQEIAEIETDKALVKVPSPKSGRVLQLGAKPGEKVKVGEVLCVIGEAGEKAVAKPKVIETIRPFAAPKKGSSTVIGELEEAPEEPVTKVVAPKKVAEPLVAVLPSVRKLAQEMGVDLGFVKGSGGRVTEDDVRKAAGQAAKEPSKVPSVAFDKFGRVLRLQLRGIRKTIAENMSKSVSTAAHVTHMDFVDMTKLAAYREREKEAAEGKGVHLTFLPFIVKACVLALKEFPYVNSSLDDATGEIVLRQYYNIGVAVDTPHGLMVPVIKSPQEKTIIEIGRDIFRVAELCRTREVQLKDLQGGTFTITNIGSIGGVFATPVINWPECAILALGRMQESPVAVSGKFEVRKMLPISLSFDHRIIDGATAAKFANAIKRRLEDPDTLLMGT
ncbi:2-oxo acid dehydrogenase subunit E2 [Candidatus Woesearchaeota archaeon]|nr:2-oxo acid dehydrogenase subunit E2 [Candidatus Woesearchaeota archaeon]